MKALALILTVTALIVSQVSFAKADNGWLNLNRQMKEQRIQQTKLNAQFKAFEAEAKRLLGEVKTGGDLKMTKQPQGRPDYDAPRLWEPAP